MRISDYRDLEASSDAWTLMAALVSEQRVWRELAQFHFNQQQIDEIMKKKFIAEAERKDWQKIFHELRRYDVQSQVIAPFYQYQIYVSGNLAFVKITSMPKYWRFVVSVAVCSGRQRGIRALPINHLIFELVLRMPVPSPIHNQCRPHSSSNISRYKRDIVLTTQSRMGKFYRFPESQREIIYYIILLFTTQY